jgi:glycerophosphoryl diester phosphodiesterase
MASVKKARDLGAPGIELDIHAAADGALVVAHDDTFLRTAPAGDNGDGKTLEELSYDVIRRIDVGSFFGTEFSSERPPLLEDVLEEFRPGGANGLYVDIELKSRKSKNDPLPFLLAQKLSAMDKKIRAGITVSSFNPICLAAFKKELAKLDTGSVRRLGTEGEAGIPSAVIFSINKELPWFLRRGFGRFIAGCDYLKPIHKQVSAFSMLRWGMEKRPVVPWTVDDKALAETLLAKGCQGIITNRPQDFLP